MSLLSVHSKFRSVNGLEVTSARITRKEYESILQMEVEYGKLIKKTLRSSVPVDPTIGACLNSYPESLETTLPGYSPENCKIVMGGVDKPGGFSTGEPITVRPPSKTLTYLPKDNLVTQEGCPNIHADFGDAFDTTSIALCKLVNGTLTVKECYDTLKRVEAKGLASQVKQLLKENRNDT